jgi:uncharacterized protein
MALEFASAIYEGTLRHRRFFPKQHEFSYSVFMVYLDLAELDSLFSLSPFWSLKRWAPIQYRRSDFHTNKTTLNNAAFNTPTPLDTSIRDTVENKTGVRPLGPIRMLVNLRYWGYITNPLSTYYCFNETGEHIVAIVAEVRNTPWNESHAYVLTGEDFGKKQDCGFDKVFHVSPFNPMSMRYHWQSTKPDKTLAIHLENWDTNTKIMDATLTLNRSALNANNMNRILIRFPCMTVKVIAAIYWQALKLWLKETPIFNHPNKNTARTRGNQH